VEISEAHVSIKLLFAYLTNSIRKWENIKPFVTLAQQKAQLDIGKENA
jgi:hypothetical protein